MRLTGFEIGSTFVWTGYAGGTEYWESLNGFYDKIK